MFDHVTIRASDRGASEQFYATVLASIGIERTYSGEDFAEWGRLLAGARVRPPSRDAAPAHRVAGAVTRARRRVLAGRHSGRLPRRRRAGERPQYSPGYYGAFLLDPDGNRAEAVHHGEPHTAGHVDHLWIRVADLAAAKRLYETIGPFAGFEVGNERPDRVSLVGDAASFSVVPGDAPTEHVHLAFPARENRTVDAFHRAALDAGYRDNGAPGERAVYHPGYYGAFVIDPDANNVEVVNHNRG